MRDGPASGIAGGVSTADIASGAASGEAEGIAGAGDAVAFADPVGTDDATEESETPPRRVVGGIDPDTVEGAPGAVVDCALTLPCRWTSEDGGFAVTVTSADDTGPREGLSIAFRVDALHDTELAFGGGAAVLDANGVSYVPIARALGAGNGNAPQGALAGEGVEGHIDHATPAGDTTLASFRLGLLDNGLAREALFANLPIGPRASVAADCALALPCTWVSDDEGATVTLVSAGGLVDLRRLTAAFTVTTSDGASIALAGAEALGVDGTPFSGRTHSLGTASGFEPVSAPTVADVPRGGTVDFSRTATAPSALRTLTLALYPDAPVPRWSVVFENVPLL